MEPTRDAIYYNYYSQRGGDFQVFKGTRYVQYGSGFGDVLRGIFRHVFPVVIRGAASFIGNMLHNRDEGQNWSSAAKSAIAPAASTILSETQNQIKQRGSGKKRKHKSKKNKQSGGKKKRRKKSKSSVYKEKKKGKFIIKEFNPKFSKYNF